MNAITQNTSIFFRHNHSYSMCDGGWVCEKCGKFMSFRDCGTGGPCDNTSCGGNDKVH